MQRAQLPLMSAPELKIWLHEGHNRLPSPCHFANQNLAGINLRGKDLSECDFTSASFEEGQDLSQTVLNKTRFEEVELVGCKLVDANLIGADLSWSDCRRTDFTNARMNEAKLTGTNLFQARFNKTRLSLKKRRILQEDRKAWEQWHRLHHSGKTTEADRLEQAIAIYLELKENFRSIGAYSEASWAYVQERRMRRRQHFPAFARRCFEADFPKSWILRINFYLWHTLIWLVDWLVDAITGYGENLVKPFLTLLLLVTMVFPWLYCITGGVGISDTKLTSYRYKDLFLLSFGNLLQGYPGLEAVSEAGKIIQGLEQFTGIMLIGLLGFILGNKVNQH